MGIRFLTCTHCKRPFRHQLMITERTLPKFCPAHR